MNNNVDTKTTQYFQPHSPVAVTHIDTSSSKKITSFASERMYVGVKLHSNLGNSSLLPRRKARFRIALPHLASTRVPGVADQADRSLAFRVVIGVCVCDDFIVDGGTDTLVVHQLGDKGVSPATEAHEARAKCMEWKKSDMWM